MKKKDVEMFILAIKERPCLYDASHKDGTNGRARAKAWAQICNVFGLPIHKARTRWKNLKDSYVKHLRSKRTNSKMLAVYVRWRWAGAMGFMEPYVRLQCSRCKDDKHVSCSQSTRNQSVRSSELCGDVGNVGNLAVAEFADGLKLEREAEPESEPSEKGENSDTYDDDPLLTVLDSRDSRSNPATSATTDDIDYLFLSYANTFKRLPSTKQVLLKAQLAQMFLTAEMEHLQQQGVTTEHDVLQFQSIFKL